MNAADKIGALATGISPKHDSIANEASERKADYKSPLTYLIAAIMFWSFNLFLFFPATRDRMWFVVGAYDFVLLFVLLSMLGQMRFG